MKASVPANSGSLHPLQRRSVWFVLLLYLCAAGTAITIAFMHRNTIGDPPPLISRWPFFILPLLPALFFFNIRSTGLTGKKLWHVAIASFVALLLALIGYAPDNPLIGIVGLLYVPPFIGQSIGSALCPVGPLTAIMPRLSWMDIEYCIGFAGFFLAPLGVLALLLAIPRLTPKTLRVLFIITLVIALLTLRACIESGANARPCC